MKNSIIADLIRIQKKISFIVLFGCPARFFLAGVEGVSMIIKLGDDTSKTFGNIYRIGSRVYGTAYRNSRVFGNLLG